MNLSTLLSDPVEFLIELLYLVPCVLITLSVHEAAHAFAALKMGDESQRYRGRISLNPFRHVDPIGFLLLLVVGFGWAKPVNVNPYAFKNPKKGMALTALAGPVSNFLLTFVGMFLCYLFTYVQYVSGAEGTASLVLYILMQFFYYLAIMSAGLGLFNLIPLPPLDGSRVVSAFLRGRAYDAYAQLERYGFLILAGILLIGNYLPALDIIGNGLTVARGWIINACDAVMRLIFRV